MPSEMKLGVAFDLHLGNPILEGLVTIGSFDGKHPSLACATAGGRIMIHTVDPKDSSAEVDFAQKSRQQQDVRFLNFNRMPTALLAAPVMKESKADLLLIGSETNVLAYNVEKNSDAYFKETQETVTAMTFGTVPGTDEKLSIVGGNCSILGFDEAGQERYWTVTSDVVTSLAMTEWKGGFNALLAGSEDFEIRVFKGEEVLETITESEKIKKIHALKQSPGRFAVALQNGTVCLYQHTERLWRFKSKHQCTALASCDLDLDGVEELLCGWSNGKFDVRADGGNRKGEAIFKETYGSAISGIVTGDYRMNGREIPVICTYDGEVKGLVTMETSAEEVIDARDRALLEDLMKAKQELRVELTTLEQQAEKQRTGAVDTTLPSTKANVQCRLRPNAAQKCIDLVLTASEGVIRSAVITGDLVFGGQESAFFYADDPSNTLACPLVTEKDVATELKVSVMVGMPMSEAFQVHDIQFRLPRFAMYVPVRELQRIPTGTVSGRLPDRVTRFQNWVSNGFNVAPADAGNTYTTAFVSVRDGSGVQLSATKSDGGSFTIHCNDMEVCGGMVQDLCEFMGLKDLATTCNFPTEFEAFTQVLQRVEEYNAVRMKLTAEMADSTQFVKALVIKAEDARILHDMRLMKRMYSSLYEVNRELMGEYMKRSNNHTELLSALKEVNNMIQKAANLRAGAPKSQVISECRQAVKVNNMPTFFNIIKTGAP